MQRISLNQISTLNNVTCDELLDLRKSLDLLVESDFEINQGAYYAYAATAVATIYLVRDDEELEYRLTYPVSDECFTGDELNEDLAQSEAFSRFCMDVLDNNDLQLDLIS